MNKWGLFSRYNKTIRDLYSCCWSRQSKSSLKHPKQLPGDKAPLFFTVPSLMATRRDWSPNACNCLFLTHTFYWYHYHTKWLKTLALVVLLRHSYPLLTMFREVFSWASHRKSDTELQKNYLKDRRTMQLPPYMSQTPCFIANLLFLHPKPTLSLNVTVHSKPASSHVLPAHLLLRVKSARWLWDTN